MNSQVLGGNNQVHLLRQEMPEDIIAKIKSSLQAGKSVEIVGIGKKDLQIDKMSITTIFHQIKEDHLISKKIFPTFYLCNSPEAFHDLIDKLKDESNIFSYPLMISGVIVGIIMYREGNFSASVDASFIGASYRRLGLMLNAKIKLFSFLFSNKKIKIINMKIDEENEASKALSIKIGSVYDPKKKLYKLSRKDFRNYFEKVQFKDDPVSSIDHASKRFEK